MYLIIKFLFHENINLSELSLDLEVTRRTVANDIKSIRNELEYFNLKIESINSIGVKLVGKEIDKRKVFSLYILKFLRDIDYLPDKLKKMLKEIKDIMEFKGIVQTVKYIVDNLEMPSSGLLMRSFEVLLSISFIRKNYVDSSLEVNVISTNGILNPLIKELLEEIKFITKYEKDTILSWCVSRSYEYIINGKTNCLERMKKLLELINLEFKSNFILTKPLLIKLHSLIKSYDFKKEYNIKEFYLHNRNLSEKYEHMFSRIKKIVLRELKGIDSFDLMIISTIFLELLTLNLSFKTQRIQN
ncbi:helix-turn-helix domain-containing protein, partial [Cetobacterium sp.]